MPPAGEEELRGGRTILDVIVSERVSESNFPISERVSSRVEVREENEGERESERAKTLWN